MLVVTDEKGIEKDEVENGRGIGSGKFEASHNNPQSRQLVTRPGFETGISPQ
jgi:hypothetical protein